ncbi:fibrinogen alpha chain [Gambusia affinis]|uniref:fibrinogen alpha chain n=1 Tax=Gambusia affinis TaxID=33528 RepID=UPI001CDB5BB3|nr:fibrinogen alpha chain [Gambusia affinis]
MFLVSQRFNKQNQQDSKDPTAGLQEHSGSSERKNDRRMKKLSLLLCLVSVAVTQATLLDPRGARPVEPATKDEKCATQREWPACSDDDWYSKCPSGCRIQGLMDKKDHELLKKIAKIRSLLDQHKARHRSVDLVSKQTYDILTEKLTLNSGNDNMYYNLAQTLRQRITEMKVRIDRQQKALAALKSRVKDQVVEMQRLEVDIDMKLRSCKGSCGAHTVYQVDRDSYVTLNKQVNQLDAQVAQSVETVGTLYVMKSRPLQNVIVDSRFKSKDAAAQRREDLFSQVNTVQFILEEEGSSSSPATVSKVPGTSHSTSPPSLSSSSGSSSKSITELSGRGDSTGHLGQPSVSLSTKTISCTKTIRRTVVHTKDGPVERVEEVGGGPECDGMGGFTKGGMGSLFPTLTGSSSSSSFSSSSSSSSSSSFHSGGSKGSILADSKSGLNPFEADFGAFMTDNTEDDVPDFHARSVKSTVVDRQAGFVGTDCVDSYQKHLKGEANGLFRIKPAGSAAAVEVYCQQEGIMGGWLLVQQRESGSVSFNRTWAEYRDGFGSVDALGKGEFWLGNQNLHLLTNQGETMLKVELEDWEGGVATAEYTVRVGTEDDGFPLQASGYTGDAGDALASHSGVKFSTFDKDNDGSGENCAEAYGGGWWYNSCQAANLNGIYHKGTYDPETNTPYKTANGVVWPTFKPATYSLKAARMFIRPATF